MDMMDMKFRGDLNRPLTWQELDNNFKLLRDSPGRQGVRGLKGAQGNQGTPGESGKDGRTILSGFGPPNMTYGLDGDYYFDIAHTTIYGPKIIGEWPDAVYLKGDTGQAGATILNGTGAPSNTIGVTNDFYVDLITQTVYGPKTSGAWPLSGVTLKGTKGDRGDTGNSIRSGHGAPSVDVGTDGDLYIDWTGQLLYGPKASGAWPVEGAYLKGEVGPIGQIGPQGERGFTGLKGDHGTSVLSGRFVPLNNVGVDGDFYLNLDTTTLYGPKSDGEWSTGIGLIGAKGDRGERGTTGIGLQGDPGQSAVVDAQTFDAAAGQTVFPITGGYTVGKIAVYVKGARLGATKYTATDGTTVVLNSATALHDEVIVEVQGLAAPSSSNYSRMFAMG